MKPSILQSKEREVRDWKHKNDVSTSALEREYEVFSKMEVEATKMGREFRAEKQNRNSTLLRLKSVAESDNNGATCSGTKIASLPLVFGQATCMSALISDILEGHKRKNDGEVHTMNERKEKMLEMCKKIEVATVLGKGVTI